MLTTVDPMLHVRRDGSDHRESTDSDFLTALLEPCRFRTRVSRPSKLAAPWGYEVAQAPPGFYLALEGSCVMELGGGSPWTLSAPDLAIVTRTANVKLRDCPESRTEPVGRLFAPMDGAHASAGVNDGTGPVTRLLCGEFTCDDDCTRQTFGLLPEVLILHNSAGGSAGPFRAFIETLLVEADQALPGASLLCDRVLQILLIHALRQSAGRLPDAGGGLIAALRVPGLGTALGAMHARPEHDWSVHELAELAGLSRAAFAARFLEVVGEPPFHYLRDVRMRLSSRLLRETEKGIKEIAARVGYSTEASFSKAFTRWCGTAPGEHRRQARTGTASDGSGR